MTSEPKTWTPNEAQAAVMGGLLDGVTPATAAGMAGVDPADVERWLKNPFFVAELSRRAAKRWGLARARALSAAARAADAMAEAADEDPENAADLLKALPTIHALTVDAEDSGELDVMRRRAARIAEAEVTAEGVDMLPREIEVKERTERILQELVRSAVDELQGGFSGLRSA